MTLLTWSFTEALGPLGHQSFAFCFAWLQWAGWRVRIRTVEVRRGGLSPLVVAGRSEEVVEDLEDDADAASRMADAAFTARGQSARESPGEDAG